MADVEIVSDGELIVLDDDDDEEEGEITDTPKKEKIGADLSDIRCSSTLL